MFYLKFVTPTYNYPLTSPQQLTTFPPVICGAGAMEFVLPRGTNSANAPLPKSDSITLKDVPAEVLAVREFPGKYPLSYFCCCYFLPHEFPIT